MARVERRPMTTLPGRARTRRRSAYPSAFRAARIAGAWGAPQYTERMSVPSSETATFLSSPRQMLVGADWRDAQAGERLDVRDPATGDVITSVPAAGAADVDLAVQAARNAFESREWGAARPVDRERWLLKLWPRSPRAMRPTKQPYCSIQLRSRQ